MNLSNKTISALADIITGNTGASPYRKGAELVGFFNEFGSDDNYEDGFGSRRPYTISKLETMNGTPVMTKVVEAAFDPRNFLSTEYDGDNAVENINQFLIFDGYKLVKDDLYYRVRSLNNPPGVDNPVKNLIFASNGPKPEIVLVDATTNDIKIVKNAKYCLIYDKKFTDRGLFWDELVAWWCELQGLQHTSKKDQQNSLYQRLLASLGDNEPERILFSTYYTKFAKTLGTKLPALIPQVYLHYDPYTSRHLNDLKRLARERMDFLLFLPHRKYVVVEIDGKQHYSKGDVAAPRLYAEMVAEDRRLKLRGYEVYRFGGYEFVNKNAAKKLIKEFFENLLGMHSILVE